ncbi:MAG: hypothetical protein ACRD7E_09955, partial [Bryobacteraceae bacterium]
MIGALTNHLWQSTLFAVVAGLLTIGLRKNPAQVRYWLWFSASFKFLVPFSVLMSLGSHLAPAPAARQVSTQIAMPSVSFTMAQITQPFSGIVPAAPSTGATGYWLPIAILAVWACGFAAIAILRLRDWLRVRSAVNSSSAIEFAAPVEVRS